MISYRQPDGGGWRMKSFSKAVSRESHVRWPSHQGIKGSKTTPEGKPPKSRKMRKFPLKAFTVLRELEYAVMLLLKGLGKGEEVEK